MAAQPDALIVTAAAWVAAGSAAWTGCARLRARRAGRAMAAVVLAAGACAGGVASAASPRPHPSGVPSLDWAALRHVDGGRTVIVHPGDCLWAITARRLSNPTVAQIAARWPDWWRVNRHVIGSDPSLIRPGQRLRQPEHLPRRH